MRTTFLWVTFLASSSSRLKRRSRSRAAAGSLSASGRITLIATTTASSSSQAWKTLPIPPSPSERMRSYRRPNRMPGSRVVVGRPGRAPAAGPRPSIVTACSGGCTMVSAIEGSAGAGGVLGAGGGEPMPVTSVAETSTGGGVSVATVTSPLTVGTAFPHAPQKRCEASTGPPQCGHIISGFLPTPFGYDVSHYGANLERETMYRSAFRSSGP